MTDETQSVCKHCHKSDSDGDHFRVGVTYTPLRGKFHKFEPAAPQPVSAPKVEEIIDALEDLLTDCVEDSDNGTQYWTAEGRKKAAAIMAPYFAQPDWSPIETAPKNGSEVLLRVKMRAGIPGKFLVGHWMPGGHCIEDHPAIDAGWYFWNGCMFDKASEPTHWKMIDEFCVTV